MRMGADYYPEHWARERWATDAKLMQEIGFNTVRIGEFAWSKLEPVRDQFDFEWLDEAIDILGQKGVEVVLCTPTATPPKWLCDEKDVFQRDGYGRIRGFGSRRHYCFNNPDYRQETKRIVTKIAQRYHDNPAVIAWQIDNEFGCHDTTLCYCEHCRAAFQEWLQKKYHTVEQLNQAWGLIFWSQELSDFSQVELPKYTVLEDSNRRGFPHNPGLLLDFARFSSESAVQYQQLQVDLLRESGCTVPITHNFMGHAPDIDYYELAKSLDFVSWDNYPLFPFRKNDYREDAMAHDLMRSVCHQNFWVMEHQSGPGGTCALGDTPKPGQLRLWSYASLAHGAEALIYFRWRTCCFGNEEYWHGVLDHDGIPRRRYFEIQKLNQELNRIGKIFEKGKNIAEIGLVKSYDNLWSDNYQWHSPGFGYNNLLRAYYNGLINCNVNCDVINLNENFKPYRLVFLPAVSLMNEEIYQKIERYVREGGTIVLTFRSGIKEWNNQMTQKPLPGWFKELSGIELTEYDSMNAGRQCSFDGAFGKGTINLWCDVIDTEKTEVLARYTAEYYAGKPCIVRNSYGAGQVFYVGCDMDAKAQDAFTRLLLERVGIEPLNFYAADGVEMVKKMMDGQTYIILLNHNAESVCLPLSFGGEELLSQKTVAKQYELEPFGVAIIKQSIEEG